MDPLKEKKIMDTRLWAAVTQAKTPRSHGEANQNDTAHQPIARHFSWPGIRTE
jgi:hypothetical protein